MLSTRSKRTLATTIIGTALVAGIIGVPAAHSANLPPANPAAIVAVDSAASFTADRIAVAEIHREAAVAQTQVAAATVKAKAAQARKALVVRTAAMRTKAVSIALSRKGMSYSAGSSGPTRFDCSGFTSYVWRTAGKTIERTSWDQFATLKPVSRAKAKPGDLVFFFGNGAHHAAFYLGHGKMIHAANYGSGVIISSVDDPWYGERISGFRSVV
ncbi:MAG: NlpC/P60 family protein [Actinobacteria bacterium]|nr:NlpC/P60 family protein [Actinomycetota bacterium]